MASQILIITTVRASNFTLQFHSQIEKARRFFGRIWRGFRLQSFGVGCHGGCRFVRNVATSL